jgi:hypothetical protein
MQLFPKQIEWAMVSQSFTLLNCEEALESGMAEVISSSSRSVKEADELRAPVAHPAQNDATRSLVGAASPPNST